MQHEIANPGLHRNFVIFITIEHNFSGMDMNSSTMDHVKHPEDENGDSRDLISASQQAS